jgi:hypothetical protein
MRLSIGLPSKAAKPSSSRPHAALQRAHSAGVDARDALGVDVREVEGAERVAAVRLERGALVQAELEHAGVEELEELHRAWRAVQVRHVDARDVEPGGEQREVSRGLLVQRSDAQDPRAVGVRLARRDHRAPASGEAVVVAREPVVVGGHHGRVLGAAGRRTGEGEERDERTHV